MTKHHHRFPWAGALTVAAGSAIYCHYAIETEDLPVCSPRLPAAFEGLRLTVLSDLHGARFGEGQSRLLRAVLRSRPDLICLCGDLLDHDTDLQDLYGLIRPLLKAAPVYFVPGNHEYARKDFEACFRQLSRWGVTVLRDDWQVLQRHGQRIIVAGADDPCKPGYPVRPGDLLRSIRQTDGGDPYVILLHHRNDCLGRWAPRRPDVILAGHGHGGVIRIPGIGGLLGVDRELFPNDEDGLYRQGRTVLAVSRGLGGLRLWNRPHVPTVVLRRGPVNDL